ncbi:MAG: hypothetical protein ACYTAN_08755 [Planctomycetota bacterium]|jgi:hypothetical protein
MSLMTRIALTDERLCWESPLGVLERRDGIVLCRFPREKLEEDGCETEAASRLRTPTGCSLRMVTDARRIAFTIRVVDTPRDWGSFVVRSEGELIGVSDKPDFAPGEYEIELDIGGDCAMREIEVLPPHILDFVFQSISIDGELGDAPTAREAA